MTKHIETVKHVRTLLLEGIKDLNAEQLNKIPAGFNNNINWNMGHLIAIQQAICYKRAGLLALISSDFGDRFKPGSKPDIVINDDEITHIKQLLLITLDRLETDYNKNIFGNYTAWTTRYGVELAGIDDGIKFLLFHERVHSDTIITIKKLVL